MESTFSPRSVLRPLLCTPAPSPCTPPGPAAAALPRCTLLCAATPSPSPPAPAAPLPNPRAPLPQLKKLLAEEFRSLDDFKAKQHLVSAALLLSFFYPFTAPACDPPFDPHLARRCGLTQRVQGCLVGAHASAWLPGLGIEPLPTPRLSPLPPTPAVQAAHPDAAQRQGPHAQAQPRWAPPQGRQAARAQRPRRQPWR